jgi:hypothetical protein
MPYQQAARLLAPIADALQYAHSHNVVHRDVKPSNILITESGQPMLTDFGIAKILDLEGGQTLTGTGVGIGTPEYMAPEQWTGSITPAVDIYSLGVVFYELVTGHKPYTADTPAAVLLNQATEPLPRPSSFIPGLPEQVEQVIYKALAKKPKDRYPLMQEFETALQMLCANTVPFTGNNSLRTSDPILNSSLFDGQETFIEGSEARPKNASVTKSQRANKNNAKLNLEKKKNRLWLILALSGLALVAFFVVLINAGDKDKLSLALVSPTQPVSTSIPAQMPQTTVGITAAATVTGQGYFYFTANPGAICYINADPEKYRLDITDPSGMVIGTFDQENWLLIGSNNCWVRTTDGFVDGDLSALPQAVEFKVGNNCGESSSAYDSYFKGVWYDIGNVATSWSTTEVIKTNGSFTFILMPGLYWYNYGGSGRTSITIDRDKGMMLCPAS